MMVGTSQVIALINWFFFCFYHYNLNSKTSLKGEIDAGIHVHDYVPLDVDFEHSDDGNDAADCWRSRRGDQWRARGEATDGAIGGRGGGGGGGKY